AHLRMAQSMAARDKAPRGVRFIVSSDATNPDKKDIRWVTELQYVEQPLPLIPNRNPLTSGNPDTEPRVRFAYTTQAGTITKRQCFIENLTEDQAKLIQAGCTIVMPVFSAWHKIKAITSGPPQSGSSNPWQVEAELEVYPDAIMGGSTHYQTYHFAIYLLPTPLVGEPTILLPKNICVDLNVSVPSQANSASDFDVLFGPDGKLVGAPTGQIFLWMRDYTKAAPYSITFSTSTPPVRSAPFLSGAPLLDAFRKGGEQHIIAVRASGSHGSNEAMWPDPSSGNYPANNDAYTLVRQETR
ncbi:MAG TPA: hypothetical protein VGE74_13515, partial [Gemmata sp.]